MASVSGRVEKVYSKEFKPGKWMYSLVVNGTFYGVGSRKPQAVEGDIVSFEASQNGKFWNAENVQITGNAGTAQSSGSAPAPASNDRQTFEERKQTAIALQSARNTSIAAVGLLLQNGGVKLPAKQADVADVVLALVDELTSRYFEEVQGIYRGEKVRTSAAVSSSTQPVEEDDLP